MKLKPLKFSCLKILKIDPEILFEEFLKVENWNDFDGFLFLPGIKKANFITQTKSITGSIINVENSDGSFHNETIIEWIPNKKIVIKFNQFSKPLSYLASHFIETWDILEEHDVLLFYRSFEIHPKGRCQKISLWFISKFLKIAICRHTKEIAKT